jgi:hypothetical protein
MKTLPVDRPTLDDPVYSQKNPHQTFLLLFSLFASAPVVFGGESASRALDRTVTPLLVALWGGVLLTGSIIALIGEFWRGHTWTSLYLERIGLALVGCGGAFYALVVYFTIGHEARYVVGITAAYSLSCLWRVVQISRRLVWIRALVAEVNRRHEP